MISEAVLRARTLSATGVPALNCDARSKHREVSGLCRWLWSFPSVSGGLLAALYGPRLERSASTEGGDQSQDHKQGNPRMAQSAVLELSTNSLILSAANPAPVKPSRGAIDGISISVHAKHAMVFW